MILYNRFYHIFFKMVNNVGFIQKIIKPLMVYIERKLYFELKNTTCQNLLF